MISAKAIGNAMNYERRFLIFSDSNRRKHINQANLACSMTSSQLMNYLDKFFHKHLPEKKIGNELLL